MQTFPLARMKILPFTYHGAPHSAAVPEFPVKEVLLFLKVGVDFAGPLHIKAPMEGMKKVYITLFFCCVTKALHLELVEDFSAETVVQALRRFTAQRGTPNLIVSDNMKTFKTKHSRNSRESFQAREENRVEVNLERAP